MDKIQEKIDNLVNHAEAYIKSRETLAKLVAAEKASKISSEVLSAVFFMFIAFIVLTFFSFSAAYFIAAYTGNIYTGFLTVTAFYAIAGLLAYLNRDKWLKEPVMNAMIKNIFKEQHHE